MTMQVAKRSFNVSEYHRMAEAGVLLEDDRVELIEGEIVEMTPIGSKHAACVKRLNRLLGHLAESEVIVSVQDPIRLDDHSEPEPDVAVLRAREDYYAEEHPTPAEVLLVIEVAETSVDYDREVKIPLYARAGIPEAWLVDLPKAVVEIYGDPREGKYLAFQQLRHGDSVASRVIADLVVPVAGLLPTGAP